MINVGDVVYEVFDGKKGVVKDIKTVAGERSVWVLLHNTAEPHVFYPDELVIAKDCEDCDASLTYREYIDNEGICNNCQAKRDRN